MLHLVGISLSLSGDFPSLDSGILKVGYTFSSLYQSLLALIGFPFEGEVSSFDHS